MINIEPWKAVDRSNLAAFLNSDTGMKLIMYAEASAPRPKPQDSLEKSALAGERYFGWMDCLEWMQKLLTQRPDTVRGQGYLPGDKPSEENPL